MAIYGESNGWPMSPEVFSVWKCRNGVALRIPCILREHSDSYTQDTLVLYFPLTMRMIHGFELGVFDRSFEPPESFGGQMIRTRACNPE